MNLLQLPVEIVLQVLRDFRTYRDLLAFSEVSRACHQLVTADLSALLRFITCSTTLQYETSAADTGSSRGELDPITTSVEDAIQAQWLFNKGYWAGVKSWLQFAQVHHELNQNWLRGRFYPRYIRLDIASAPQVAQRPRMRGVWRFKLDTCVSIFVTSGAGTGGMQVFDGSNGRQGRYGWSTYLPSTAWPHVELSQGHFFMYLRSSLVAVWRLSALNDLMEPLLEPSSPIYRDLKSTTHFRFSPDPHPYEPFSILRVPQECTATKARFPFYIAVSPDSSVHSAYVFHVVNGGPPMTIDLNLMYKESETPAIGDLKLTYVDFDERYVFIALRGCIGVWRLDDGTFVRRLPSSGGVEERREEWDTLHVDLIGRNLVAAACHDERPSAKGKVLWIKDYWEWLEKEETDADRNIMVLDLGDYKICQLSVENDRAVLVASYGSFTTYPMFLINLTHDAVPTPILMHPCLPTSFPPSRVEQTSTSVYVLAQSALLDFGQFSRLGTPHASYWEWRTLNGTMIHSGGGGSENDTMLTKWREAAWHKALTMEGETFGLSDTMAEFCFEKMPTVLNIAI